MIDLILDLAKVNVLWNIHTQSFEHSNTMYEIYRKILF